MSGVEQVKVRSVESQILPVSAGPEAAPGVAGAGVVEEAGEDDGEGLDEPEVDGEARGGGDEAGVGGRGGRHDLEGELDDVLVGSCAAGSGGDGDGEADQEEEEEGGEEGCDGGDAEEAVEVGAGDAEADGEPVESPVEEGEEEEEAEGAEVAEGVEAVVDPADPGADLGFEGGPDEADAERRDVLEGASEEVEEDDADEEGGVEADGQHAVEGVLAAVEGCGDEEEDEEAGEGHAVQEAFEQDGGEDGAFAQAVAVGRDEGADELARPGRQDVVGHEADGGGLDERGGPYRAGGEEEAPFDPAEEDVGHHGRGDGGHPEVVDVAEELEEVLPSGPAEGEVEEDEGDAEMDGEVRQEGLAGEEEDGEGEEGGGEGPVEEREGGYPEEAVGRHGEGEEDQNQSFEHATS